MRGSSEKEHLERDETSCDKYAEQQLLQGQYYPTCSEDDNTTDDDTKSTICSTS